MITLLEQKQRLENLQQLIKHTASLLDYCHPSSRAEYVQAITKEIQFNRENIDRLNEDAKQGNITTEMACVDISYWTDENLWRDIPVIFDADTYGDDTSAYDSLCEAITQLIDSLEGLGYSLQHAPKKSYEQFHGLCTVHGSALKAKRDYEAWKVDNMTEENTYELLRDKRNLEFFNFFLSNFLRFDQCPSHKQQRKNTFEFDFDALPAGVERNAATDTFCASLDRYLKWPNKKIMELQFDKIGKYLFSHFYSLDYKDHKALTYMEIMLESIQADMQSCQEVEVAENVDFPAGTEVIFTPEGLKLLKIAQKEGWLDEKFQPINLSNSRCAALADAIAYRLQLKNRWKPFLILWGKKNLRTALDNALNQPKTIEFTKLIDEKFD